MDFILNGRGQGDVAQVLLANDFQVGALRPFRGRDGRSYMTINEMVNGEMKERTVVANTTAALRKDDWIELDTAIIKAAKERLRAVADLRSAGLVYNIPNGMSKTVLQYERQSDITEATISMNGLRQSQSDRPYFDLNNLPLPIIHKDFELDLRGLRASQNGGSPLDTTTGELAGRRVGEMAEKLLLGLTGTYQYGGGTVYGYTNYTGRMTASMTLPTAPGWTPGDTVEEVLGMKQQSQLAFHYGPWMLYNSPNWDQYLDNDYSAAKGDLTLRDRLKKIDGIRDVRTLDFLTGYQMILVQLTSDVIREVIGMDVVTLQWETHGGMMQNYKVMCIMVPQLRSDINGKTGIVHGTAA